MSFYNASTAANKSSEITAPSTDDWRAYWAVHGTSWRTLFQLHCEIVDRLRSNSSLWVST
jgi:hypothetical protein